MTKVEDIWEEWHGEELLGSGAYGSVWRAARTSHGHTSYAAVKIMDFPQDEAEIAGLVQMGMDDAAVHDYLEELANDVMSEIAAMDAVKGARNVVAIEDYKLVEHERGFSVGIRMELLEDLPTYYQRVGDPSPAEVAKLGIDVCRALEACHEHGIIHRDIKPQNVFVSAYGDYKLGDFGISRRLEQGATTVLSQRGTRSYMAPEVFLGKRYGSSVDIYSLGLMLYRFLNGMRGPFVPPAPARVTPRDLLAADERRVRGDEVPAPSYADQGLAAIVLKACSAVPQGRYASARRMREALEAWLEAGGKNQTTALGPSDAGTAQGTGTQEGDWFSTVSRAGSVSAPGLGSFGTSTGTGPTGTGSYGMGTGPTGSYGTGTGPTGTGGPADFGLTTVLDNTGAGDVTARVAGFDTGTGTGTGPRPGTDRGLGYELEKTGAKLSGQASKPQVTATQPSSAAQPQPTQAMPKPTPSPQPTPAPQATQAQQLPNYGTAPQAAYQGAPSAPAKKGGVPKGLIIGVAIAAAVLVGALVGFLSLVGSKEDTPSYESTSTTTTPSEQTEAEATETEPEAEAEASEPEPTSSGSSASSTSTEKIGFIDNNEYYCEPLHIAITPLDSFPGGTFNTGEDFEDYEFCFSSYTDLDIFVVLEHRDVWDGADPAAIRASIVEDGENVETKILGWGAREWYGWKYVYPNEDADSTRKDTTFIYIVDMDGQIYQLYTDIVTYDGTEPDDVFEEFKSTCFWNYGLEG